MNSQDNELMRALTIIYASIGRPPPKKIIRVSTIEDCSFLICGTRQFTERLLFRRKDWQTCLDGLRCDKTCSLGVQRATFVLEVLSQLPSCCFCPDYFIVVKGY
jgi:hypothetical protein